jgi:Spy/CpxP family protein refolding chaperone
MNRTAFVVIMAMTFALAAYGQPGPTTGGPPGQEGQRPARRAQMREAFMEKLNLTDQQKEQFRKLRLDMDRKHEKTMSKIKLARIDLRELATADGPDKATIEKKLREISDLQHQQKLDMVDHLFAAKAVLTPEQQKIWKEHMKEVLPEMGEMGQRMMMGMRGQMRRHSAGMEPCASSKQ